MIHLIPLQELHVIVCFLLRCTSCRACSNKLSQDMLSVHLVVADSHLLTSMRFEGNFPQQHKFALPAKYGGSAF